MLSVAVRRDDEALLGTVVQQIAHSLPHGVSLAAVGRVGNDVSDLILRNGTEQGLEFFAAAYGIAFLDRKKRIDEIIQVFGFQKIENQKSEDLPLGFKQRLSLACALIHNPPILFLDEPTSGVDVVTRRDFWNHITSLAEKGVTILVTTHFMDEAEYCDRISLFYHGETIAVGTPQELKNQAHAENMEDTFITLIKESEKQ